MIKKFQPFIATYLIATAILLPIYQLGKLYSEIPNKRIFWSILWQQITSNPAVANGSVVNPSSINGIIYCDGVKYTTLNAAVGAASSPGAVVIPLGSVCPVTSNLTVSTSITLIFQSSSQVNVANATTLTIQGPIIANANQRIFSFTGTGSVAFGPLGANNVSPMWFGAVGDCSTDDTTAFQATITSVTGGGTILVPNPPTCFLINAGGTKALTADSSSDLTIKGASENIGSSGNNGRPLIIFNGNPSTSYLSVQSSNRVTLKSLKLQYNNSSFTGKVVDFTNSTNPTLDHMMIAGSSPAVNASKLVDFTGVSDDVRVLYSTFGNSTICVDMGGASSSVITGNDFGSSSLPCSTTELTGLAQGSQITGNVFEMLTNTGTQTAIDATAFSCIGCFFGGNWFGDMATGYTGPLIKGSSGMAFIGNRFQGISTGTLLQINGGQTGIVFEGNYSNLWGTVFSCNAGLNQFVVSGNQWATITTFQSGCIVQGTTQGGPIVDNNSKSNYFGTITNDNALAGAIGEVISSTIATGSSVSLSTGTTANVTSVSLTAGDWDCNGAVDFTFGATTSYTNLVGSISTTSATLGAQDSKFDYETPAAVPTATSDSTFVLPSVRESLASTTTVFLVSQATFTVSTLKAYGTLRCRRVR